MLKHFIRRGAALALMLMPLQIVIAQTEAEKDAKELADTVRDFNDKFGDVVDGEMTEAQIAEFERMITPAFDVKKVHAGQCRSLAYISVMSATTILIGQRNPAMAEIAEQVRSEIVVGSIQDWLVQFTLPLVETLGFERTMDAVSFQCMQKKYVHAMYADLVMDSQEMDEAENCLLNQVC